MMSYKVYKVSYSRNRQAIFVETDEDGSGFIYHVIGNIQSEMHFEKRKSPSPETSLRFVEKSLLGWVSAIEHHHVESICAAVPPPKKQSDLATRLYRKEPLRRCGEWTSDAVEALKSASILHIQQPAASSSPEAAQWNWSEEYQSCD